MAVEVDEKELKAAGAEVLSDGRRGLRIRGWEIESSNRSILNSRELQLYPPFLSFLLYVMMFGRVLGFGLIE